MVMDVAPRDEGLVPVGVAVEFTCWSLVKQMLVPQGLPHHSGLSHRHGMWGLTYYGHRPLNPALGPLVTTLYP